MHPEPEYFICLDELECASGIDKKSLASPMAIQLLNFDNSTWCLPTECSIVRAGPMARCTLYPLARKTIWPIVRWPECFIILFKWRIPDKIFLTYLILFSVSRLPVEIKVQVGQQNK